MDTPRPLKRKLLARDALRDPPQALPPPVQSPSLNPWQPEGAGPAANPESGLPPTLRMQFPWPHGPGPLTSHLRPLSLWNLGDQLKEVSLDCSELSVRS